MFIELESDVFLNEDELRRHVFALGRLGGHDLESMRQHAKTVWNSSRRSTPFSIAGGGGDPLPGALSGRAGNKLRTDTSSGVNPVDQETGNQQDGLRTPQGPFYTPHRPDRW